MKDKSKKPQDTLLANYNSEYTRWLGVLEKFHTGRFDKNYRQYTSYTDTRGTSSKISDPVAPEQVERVVQKLFEREPKFFALARGNNIPKPIQQVISSAVSYFWSSPERVMTSGTMRSKMKVWGREFCITGNLVTEAYYNNESETPDCRIIPIEDVIFDPTKTLKTSSVYYIRQYVSLKYLEDNIKHKDPETGVEIGLFDKSAVDKLKADRSSDDVAPLVSNARSNAINRTGDAMNDVDDQVELVSRWEGTKLCRIADWVSIIQEEQDPLNIESNPLQVAMDIEVPKQPYAFSLLDFINGITSAKDLLLNQIVDYGSKSLNPPLFVDPTLSPVNRVTLRNAYKIGGIVFAPPGQVEHKAMPPMNPEAFNLMNYLQQRAEQSSGIGAYLGGVPNQVSDKTSGTKGGIEALIGQAQSPVRDRQLNIEESIIEPMVNKWLKIAGNLMGQNEFKYVLISGQSPKWVKLTRGILTGKITLNDLLEAELIEQEELPELQQLMLAQGKDPEKDVIYDVDWIVRVETGSLAEVDTAKDLEAFDGQIEKAIALGLNVDRKKVWVERAERAGIKEPEQYLMEEPQQQGMPGQPGQMPPQAIGSTPVQVPQMPQPMMQ